MKIHDENEPVPANPSEYFLWDRGYSKEDRAKILAIAYGLDLVLLERLIATATKKEEISSALNRRSYDTYMRAKQVLAYLGNSVIPSDRLHSMLRRINDLEKEIGEWEKIADKGFDLIYSITEAITYNNETDAEKGNWALPVSVVIKMNEFVQILHDANDKKLPLIED